MTLTINERIERLQSHYLANRIIRFTWWNGEKTSDGYELACLLAAFSPEAGEAKDASACPADAMPRWLANLTPSLDDRVSNEAWPRVVQRYVEVLPKMVRLPAERLVRLDFETRAVAVRESRRHTTDLRVLAAIDGVLVLLDRAAAGREVSDEEWAAQAAEATTEAAEAASTTWAKAAKAAAEAKAAEEAAGVNAAFAVTEAAKAASWAAELSEGSHQEAAWDAMADAMLSAWELAV